MQWSRITRKTVSLVGVRREERGNEDAAGIIQPLLQTLLVSVNMMIPLIRPFWDVSMFKYSGLHHHASFTHTHTYIQEMFHFCLPDSTHCLLLLLPV